jgi:iron complex transport system substrate-binding protein
MSEKKKKLIIRRFRPMKKWLPPLFVAALAFAAAAGEKIKIVSLSPAMTEIICQLGGGELLVGRSSACDYPENVKQLPIMGNFANPALERIAAAAPTLLVTDVFQDVGVRKSIENLGIEVVESPLQSLADYRTAVKLLGGKIGRTAEAEQELARLDRTLESLKTRREARADRPKPAILFIIWHDPVMTPGRKSFITELIELAGGASLGATENRDYFRCSPEWIVRSQPQIIIYPGNMGDAGAFTPPSSWRNLPAVKNGKIFRPANPDIYLRLGPRVTAALTELEQIIVE